MSSNLFPLPELMARVRGLLRRSQSEPEITRLSAGDLELDRGSLRVYRGSRDVHLGPTEFRSLECLLEQPGRVFTREALITRLWGEPVEIESRTVDVDVGRLRKALTRAREHDPIRTVRQVGYSFDETYGKSAAWDRRPGKTSETGREAALTPRTLPEGLTIAVAWGCEPAADCALMTLRPRRHRRIVWRDFCRVGRLPGCSPPRDAGI